MYQQNLCFLSSYFVFCFLEGAPSPSNKKKQPKTKLDRKQRRRGFFTVTPHKKQNKKQKQNSSA